MKVVNGQGKEIASLQDWARLFSSPRNRRHWKEERSAYSLGDSIVNQNGAAHLESAVPDVLNHYVTFQTTVPEFKAKFDSYGGPNNLDLGINRVTSDGPNVVVGVEAKVDERFGNTVAVCYIDRF